MARSKYVALVMVTLLAWVNLSRYLSRPTCFEDCVAWARCKFEEYVVNKIVQLTFLYPMDAVNSSGGRFWTPPKRFPHLVNFDSDDPVCMQFIVAASNLRAKVCVCVCVCVCVRVCVNGAASHVCSKWISASLMKSANRSS